MKKQGRVGITENKVEIEEDGSKNLFPTVKRDSKKNWVGETKTSGHKMRKSIS